MLVIALIAIVFVGMTPLLSASFRERKLRAAAEGIEEMVRAQRAQAQNDGRRHVLEIRSQGFFDRAGKDSQVLGAPGADELYVRFPGAKWEKPAGQSWEFSPIGMVTPFSVRLENGNAWIEVDFDMLTGRVAEERYAF
jgi:hypothetical protein